MQVRGVPWSVGAGSCGPRGDTNVYFWRFRHPAHVASASLHRQKDFVPRLAKIKSRPPFSNPLGLLPAIRPGTMWSQRYRWQLLDARGDARTPDGEAALTSPVPSRGRPSPASGFATSATPRATAAGALRPAAAPTHLAC